MDFQELIDDHDRIDRLAARLEKTVEENRHYEADIDVILDDLAITVADHLQKEDSFIYPQLAASADPADATSLVVEFEEIKRDWKEYLSHWSDGQAVNDWSAFKTNTSGMLKRLRMRVMKETGLLYSMALREELIELKPRPRVLSRAQQG